MKKNIEFSDGDAVGHGPWNGVSDDSLSGRSRGDGRNGR